MDMQERRLEPEGFDWSGALVNAGIAPRIVDVTHLTFEERMAQIEARIAAGLEVAASIGLPVEEDEAGLPIPVALSAEAVQAINAVTVAREHLEWVASVVSAIPVEMRYAGASPALSANECVEDHGLSEPGMAQALVARAIALCRWSDAHDPQHLAYREAVTEAAVRAPVIYADGLPGFDAATFGELIEFVTDLPY